MTWDSTITTVNVTGTVSSTNMTVSAAPVDPFDVTNKQYVDSQIGTVPGLPNNSVQFNDAGSFTGSSDFTWDNTLKKLIINGDVVAQNHLSVSDSTLKSNILPLDHDTSLDLLLKIECYEYNLLNSSSQTYGVMAQQLENIGLDNIVNQDQNYKSVAYIQLIPLIISSIKKLNEQLRSQNTYVPFKPFVPSING